jgi:hypothetical protein
MLSRLDPNSLSGAALGFYNFALEGLRPQERPFEFEGETTIEVFAHNNTEQFISQDTYIRHPNLMKPFADFKFDFFLTNHGYGYFEIPVMGLIYGETPEAAPYTDVTIPASTRSGAHGFGLNLPFTGGLKDLSFFVPFRTLVAFGGRGWNFQIGRDRLSWGNGESGNFMVGDHVHYHNAVRATFYNGTFKYMYNISSFPNPREYYDLDANGDVNGWRPSNESKKVSDGSATGVTTDPNSEGLNLFIAHRLEWRLFREKLGFALSESVMYQSETGTIIPDALLPSMLLHDLYHDQNQNSLLALEADFSVFPRLNIYGQMAVDEFNIPLAERPPGPDNEAWQDTFAFMAGAKTAFPLWRGMFSASFEYVKTPPNLYLHAPGEGGTLTYIVANRYADSTLQQYGEEFLGYRWGGDARVFNLRASYREFGRWDLTANLFLMTHGTRDKWSAMKKVYSTDTSNTGVPTDVPITENHQGVENYADADAQTTRNAAYVMTAFSLTGSWQFLPDYRVYGQIDFVSIENFGNISGVDASDVQLTLGVTYSF